MLGTFLVIVTTYITWLVYARFFRPSPLDHLSGPPPTSRLLGNLSQLVDPIKGWDFQRYLSEHYGSIVKMRGVFGERLLVVSDAKALHHILVKNQEVYEIGTPSLKLRHLIFGPSLLAALGKEHRKQRRLMNPVFSIKHMRDLTPIFYDVTKRLQILLKGKLENGAQEIDLLRWISRTSLEIIGQSGMDYSFHSLTDDNDHHPYTKSVKKLPMLISGPMALVGIRLVIPLAAKIRFTRLKRFIAEHIPLRRAHELVNAVDVMYSTSIDIIEAKKKALASTHPDLIGELANKKDIISILMRANAEAAEEDRLTDEEVISQPYPAPTGDTSGCPGKATRGNSGSPEFGPMDHDTIVSLPYLDAVCRETLRVYPPVVLPPTRTARRDMVLPLSHTITDSSGKGVTEIYIPKGTNLVISVFAANCNPDIWGPDSYEWKPERWLQPLPNTVKEENMPGVYSHLMTFLGGTRACIGFKFAQLGMKVILSVLLTSFQFSLSDKEIVWRMNAVAGPMVKGADEQGGQLPLRLSLLDS